jgi:hypothetical protein
MNRANESEDPLDTRIRETLGEGIPPDTERRLRERLHDFRGQMALAGGRVSFGRGGLRDLLRFAAPLATAAAVLIVAWVVFDGMSRPTWAQVAERFGAAPFVSAAIYVKEHALAEPVQIELWMGQGGKVRMRAGHEMWFGDAGRLVEKVAVGEDTGPRPGLDKAREMTDGVIRSMSAAGTFTLETLIAALPVDGAMALPMENQLVQVAGDLIVFDITMEDAPDWVRIWAYRDSRLPARVLYWDPETGESADVVLAYGEMPVEGFFDPGVFRDSLNVDGHPADRAYSLVKDPGGRPMAPKDLETQP